MLTESHSVPLSVKNGLEISESDSMGLRYKLFCLQEKEVKCYVLHKGRVDFYLFPEKKLCRK